MMYKLLRCTCLSCFHFKMDATTLARFRRRLSLLLQVRSRCCDFEGSCDSLCREHHSSRLSPSHASGRMGMQCTLASC